MRKILILVLGVFVIVGIYRNKLHRDLYERFPKIDRKVVRKAYSKMMRDAASGKIDNLSNLSDREMDRIFIRYALNVV